MFQTIKKRLYREAFLTSPLAILISPIYIIRNGLYKAIRHAAPKIQGNTLDLGCGSKPYESLFTYTKSYIGVDVKCSGHNHKNSKVDHYYDGKTLPFSSHSFDSVVSFEVLEHIFNIDEIFNEIHRVLKPNGIVLISIPFAWDEHEIPHDFARYTSYGILHIFQNHGFDVLELKKTTTYVLAVFQMFIAYLYQHVAPKNLLFSKTFQLLLIFPLNVLAILLNCILPKRYEYFCNSVVMAKKLEEG